jgi:hypothetical protein
VFDNNDLSAGDIIEIQADTPGGSKVYREEVTWGSNDGGSSENPVILQPRSGDIVSISAADLASSWNGPDGNGEYWISATTTVRVCLVDGSRIESGSSIGSLKAGEYKWGGGSLYYKPPTDTVPSDYTIEYGVRDSGLIIDSVDYVTVQDINIYGCNKGSHATEANLYIGSLATNITVIESNEAKIYGSSNHGIITDGDTISISNYEITDCMNSGLRIAGNSDDVTLVNLSVHDNAGLDMDDNAGGDGGGIGFYSGSTNATLSSSSIYNNGLGILAQAGLDYGVSVYEATYITIDGNNIYDNAGGGIYVDTNTTGTPASATIQRNLIHGNGRTTSGKNLDGIRVAGQAADAIATATIYNNTLYGNKIGRPGSPATERGHILVANFSTVRMRNNNICSPTAAESGSAKQVYAAHKTVSFTASHNNYSGLEEWQWQYVGKTSLGDWQTASSQDANSILDSPLFVDASGDDFHLQSGSPCIDAGTDVGLTEDYAGNSVPKGDWPDIGAYESEPY